MNNKFLITAINRIVMVGKNEYAEKKTTFTHNLKCNELIFHFSGESTVYFGDKTMHITKDTVRFLPKGNHSKYIVERKAFGECIMIAFDSSVLISDEAFTINPQNAVAIGNLFKKIFAVWVSKNEGYYFECISLLYKIFAELQKKNYIPQNQYNLIKPAIEYIEENFLRSKISVPYLANKCGISEVYLKKLFIKKFGMPPTKYTIQLKINHACDLLRSECYSITQVANLCGYEDVYYFSRQFKNYVGVTPSAFEQRQNSNKQ